MTKVSEKAISGLLMSDASLGKAEQDVWAIAERVGWLNDAESPLPVLLFREEAFSPSRI